MSHHSLIAWLECQKSAILPDMRTLSLTTPHVVIMVGVPGSGKSFFADRFAETFSAPLVSWNLIRKELFNHPDYSKDEDEIVERVAGSMLEQLFKTRATIVLEADMLMQVSRQDFAKKLRSIGYTPLFVWVQTDPTATKSRSLKQGMPADVYAAAVKRFTPLKESDPFVVVSGKHTFASQLKIVLRRLSSDRALAAKVQSSRETNPSKSAAGRRLSVQ